MSGLVALLHRDGRPAEEKSVWDMLVAAPYRGPDGMRTWLSGPVALGHAKMAVTPEDQHDQQPLVSPRTGCVIIADVRLDNRDQLLACLPDAVDDSCGDAELILRAYELWGLESASRLLGDFAFVIWDPRGQRLFCARDTSGQRVLFYRFDARDFAAASEIHQLLQDPAVPIAPCEERIRDYLVPLNVVRNDKDHPLTFFQGIFTLPAAHSLIVDRQTMRVQRYWELRTSELRYHRDEEYVERFQELFREAVRTRLRSTRPVGALLSGGLDSGSIVATAQELFHAGKARDHGFVTFSFVFDDPRCDESSFIRDIQAKYGFTAHYLKAEKFRGRFRLEPSGFDAGPNGDSSAGSGPLSLASQADVRVVLTGDVGDACVGGSAVVFDSLLRRRALRAFWRYWRTYRGLTTEPLSIGVTMGCLVPLLPLGVQRRIRAAAVRRAIERNIERYVPGWMAEPLRQELAQLHLRYAVEEQHDRRFGNPGREADYRLMYPPEVAWHPAPWPVELSRPYADRRLHEFVLAIPPEQRYDAMPDSGDVYAGSKRLVRLAMRGILPESVRTRPSKTVFLASLDSDLETYWLAYEPVFGPSSRSEVAARGYVEPTAFWTRLQNLRAGKTGADFIYILLYSADRLAGEVATHVSAAPCTAHRRPARRYPVGGRHGCLAQLVSGPVPYTSPAQPAVLSLDAPECDGKGLGLLMRGRLIGASVRTTAALGGSPSRVSASGGARGMSFAGKEVRKNMRSQYRRPTAVELGPIEQFTQGSGGSKPDYAYDGSFKLINNTCDATDPVYACLMS